MLPIRTHAFGKTSSGGGSNKTGLLPEIKGDRRLRVRLALLLAWLSLVPLLYYLSRHVPCSIFLPTAWRWGFSGPAQRGLRRTGSDLSTIPMPSAPTDPETLIRHIQTYAAGAAARMNHTAAQDHIFRLNTRRYTLEEYEAGLREVWADFFIPGSARISSSGPRVQPKDGTEDPRLASILRHMHEYPVASPPLTKTVWTTSTEPETTKEDWWNWWEDNPGWTSQWTTDDDIDVWLAQEFGADSGIAYEMKEMRGEWGILRADIFRYLILLINGGIYSDSDTACQRPLSDWMNHTTNRLQHPVADALERLHEHQQPLSSGLRATVPEYDEWPNMLLALEEDCHRKPQADKSETGYPRCGQFVQWTILAKANHPVLLDVLVEGLQTWRAWREARDRGERLPRPTIMEWFGPAAVSDSVLRYLMLKYGTGPLDVEDLDGPISVGDVVVLPQRAFHDTEVWHGFHGLQGWKTTHWE